MSILVINAGSTSLKFGLFDSEARETLVSGTIDWADGNRQAVNAAAPPSNEVFKKSLRELG